MTDFKVGDRVVRAPLHTFEFVVTVRAANRQAAEEVLSALPDDVAVKEVVA